MTVTTLDPNTALIVIDLQKGIVGFPTVHPIGGVLASATVLTAAFRRRGLPVVLVNVTGVAPGRTEQSHSLEGLPTDWADLVPELNAQPNDLLVTKRTWGAF
jgi:nicotinamidase-related amidase